MGGWAPVVVELGDPALVEGPVVEVAAEVDVVRVGPVVEPVPAPSPSRSGTRRP